MIEKQIQQNAEAYANKAAPITRQNKGIPLAIHTAAEVAYINGAHSRDKEIKQLEAANKILKKALEYNVDTYEKELDQLRNPWISVEDRLPERSNEDNIFSIKCIVRYTNEYFYPGETFYTEAYYDYDYEEQSPYHIGGWVAAYENDEHFFFSDYEENGCRVTHWMYIPELKKGE